MYATYAIERPAPPTHRGPPPESIAPPPSAEHFDRRPLAVRWRSRHEGREAAIADGVACRGEGGGPDEGEGGGEHPSGGGRFDSEKGISQTQDKAHAIVILVPIRSPVLNDDCTGGETPYRDQLAGPGGGS